MFDIIDTYLCNVKHMFFFYIKKKIENVFVIVNDCAGE